MVIILQEKNLDHEDDDGKNLLGEKRIQRGRDILTRRSGTKSHDKPSTEWALKMR